jgi:hypothetical protein
VPEGADFLSCGARRALTAVSATEDDAERVLDAQSVRGYRSRWHRWQTADMTILGRLLDWLRRRKPKREDTPQPIRKSSDRGEREPHVDPVEELAKLIGQTEPGDPLSRGKPTSARRIRSRRHP